MKGIQLILLFFFLASLFVFLKGKFFLLERLVGITLFGIVALLIFNPSITSFFANLLGVGRGNDLIFYLSIAFFIYLSEIFYKRLKILEQHQSCIVRDISLISPLKQVETKYRMEIEDDN